MPCGDPSVDVLVHVLRKRCQIVFSTRCGATRVIPPFEPRMSFRAWTCRTCLSNKSDLNPRVVGTGRAKHVMSSGALAICFFVHVVGHPVPGSQNRTLAGVWVRFPRRVCVRVLADLHGDVFSIRFLDDHETPICLLLGDGRVHLSPHRLLPMLMFGE